MRNYTTYTEITKEILDNLSIGDLVKVNDWKKPMRVKCISENYVVIVQKQFKETYYSVIEKKRRNTGDHNAMRQGLFHCGKDDWIFGDSEFRYNFDDTEAVARYLQTFETEEAHLSERNAIPILTLHVKSEVRGAGAGNRNHERQNKTPKQSNLGIDNESRTVRPRTF
ncbi:hypothetical protein SPSIL_008830 [Sporomusa silvacetica DSM 10669]|uniref:Uncharacterized protein n=1 Tax=Sporomusa silvacetica DSM 10669 TaxID=1123289 RepID=A0ABZ3IGG7_9FIRM|nr:hypothetical protein [Sporomusa silvacetica]OZC13157.1 hypothetical protein SPSIL_56130 [Sporomusa silvacetica DSM 10669]